MHEVDLWKLDVNKILRCTRIINAGSTACYQIKHCWLSFFVWMANHNRSTAKTLHGERILKIRKGMISTQRILKLVKHPPVFFSLSVHCILLQASFFSYVQHSSAKRPLSETFESPFYFLVIYLLLFQKYYLFLISFAQTIIFCRHLFSFNLILNQIVI